MSQKKQAGKITKSEAREATRLLRIAFSKFLKFLPVEDKVKLAMDLVEYMKKDGGFYKEA